MRESVYIVWPRPFDILQTSPERKNITDRLMGKREFDPTTWFCAFPHNELEENSYEYPKSYHRPSFENNSGLR